MKKKLNNAHIHTQKIGYIFKMEKKINNKNYFNLLYWYKARCKKIYKELKV